MRNDENRSCGCKANNCPNRQCENLEVFRNSIDEIVAGINECNNNVMNILKCRDCEGIRSIQSGIGRMEEGIDALRRDLRCMDENRNCEALKSIQEGMRDIEEGISGMEDGIQDLRCNRREGIRQIREGIQDSEEGLQDIIDDIARLNLEECEEERECCGIKNIKIDISFNREINVR